MHRDRWTAWTISLERLVVELDERLTRDGLALELDVWVGAHGILGACWRLEDGRRLAPTRVGCRE